MCINQGKVCLSSNIFFLYFSCYIFWKLLKICILMHKNLTNVKSENKLFEHNESRKNLSAPNSYCYLNALHFMKNIASIKFWNTKRLQYLFPYSICICMPQSKPRHSCIRECEAEQPSCATARHTLSSASAVRPYGSEINRLQWLWRYNWLCNPVLHCLYRVVASS